MRSRRLVPTQRHGFTLVEILIVIGIISLLVTLLFPVFQGLQERSRQATCLANLQQIYLAVRLYKDDEREYPMSLAALLPDTTILQPAAGSADSAMGANIGGTGYFRQPDQTLICPNDPTNAPALINGVPNLRSSYGDVSNAPLRAASYENAPNYNARDEAFYSADQDVDWGRVSWNYWGYDDRGVAFRSPDEALSYLNGLPPSSAKQLLKIPDKQPASGFVAPGPYQSSFSSSGVYFNPRGVARNTLVSGSVFLEEPREENPLRYSLANRFAPAGTIITHCVYHRAQTGQRVYGPNPSALYAGAGTGARDLILRVDGTVKSYDVTSWRTPPGAHAPLWQISDF